MTPKAHSSSHGLRLAEMLVSELTATQRAQLVVVSERHCSYRVRRDGDPAQQASGRWPR